MDSFKIQIENEDEGIYLDAYLPCECKKNKKAMLVIPGGGYMSWADREGEPIAKAFCEYGFSSFVLHYYVGREKPFPIQLIQAQKAIKHIKDNAKVYGINPDEVFAVGFSAGGHLAGSCAILNNIPAVYESIDMPYGYTNLKGAMLIYPVVSAKYHTSSFKNLLCSSTPTDEELKAVSLEEQVTESSAPVFIMHTSNDSTVDVRSSLVLAEAYSRAKIQYEMHIYPDAPHGIALATPLTSCERAVWENKRIAEWVRLASEWTDEIK